MDPAPRTTADDWPSILLAVVVVVVIAELPAFCVYDVLSHDRLTIGLTRQSTWLIELIHAAYSLTAVVALAQIGRDLFGVIFPEGRAPDVTGVTKKPVMSGALRTALLVAYVLPLFWLLSVVPGYWRVVLDAWGDW